MNTKVSLIIAVTVYLLALFVNFFVAIKYPDLSINTSSCLISFVMLLILIVYSFFGGKIYKVVMSIGALSGLFICVAQNYQDVIYDIWILDILSALHYPLYVIYIIPLFGINLLFDYTPSMYSLLVAALFLVCFIISVSIQKSNSVTTSIQKKPSKN